MYKVGKRGAFSGVFIAQLILCVLCLRSAARHTLKVCTMTEIPHQRLILPWRGLREMSALPLTGHGRRETRVTSFASRLTAMQRVSGKSEGLITPRLDKI